MPRSTGVRRRLVAVAVASLALTSSCGSAPGTSDPEGVDGLVVPTPSPEPGDFVEVIDNPYLPLTPGSTWTYEASGSEGEGRVTVTVTDRARVVAGVRTTVVSAETTDARGRLVEESQDWYAQDLDGNVWSFGERGTDGDWEAGVEGAQAGIAMLATPRLGDGYRHEYRAGVAEDQAEVIATAADLTLGVEGFDRVVKTADTSVLQPGLMQVSYYAPAIGLVLRETVAGGDRRLLLVEHRAG